MDTNEIDNRILSLEEQCSTFRDVLTMMNRYRTITDMICLSPSDHFLKSELHHMCCVKCASNLAT